MLSRGIVPTLQERNAAKLVIRHLHIGQWDGAGVVDNVGPCHWRSLWDVDPIRSIGEGDNRDACTTERTIGRCLLSL